MHLTNTIYKACIILYESESGPKTQVDIPRWSEVVCETGAVLVEKNGDLKQRAARNKSAAVDAQ